MKYNVETESLTIPFVSEVYQAGKLHIEMSKDVEIDLTQIKKIDISGVSMLFALIRFAKKKGANCRFKVNEVIKQAVAHYSLELLDQGE